MTPEIEGCPAADGPFRLGEWLVEPRLNRLTRDGQSIQIELKMMDVLLCLAENPGDLVERQTLIDTVWATEFISENILTRAIAELRRSLGDDAKEPTYIETIHRRGYRLMVPVEPVEQAAATVHPFPTPVVCDDDDRSPYPGLAAFTEDEAEFFFGREAEVSQLWRKITMRRLLAVIGPSGVGKSSFLRAGLIPSAPGEWGILVCHPGEAPFAALARTLAPEFRDDPDAFSKATDFEGNALHLFTRWRANCDHALLIVDQFEELFTQNTPDVQSRFSDLLGRLAREADVHVLLSMRDDFMYRCHEHLSLSPIFDGISPISNPTRANIRRALTEPAARFGFSFEDEAIIDEMLDAVEGERGGLPLLAFTVARLWDARNSEDRLLTRGAYAAMGGVHGALAQHAEASLSAIGGRRLPIAREIFRNLVTAEGTRATRGWTELLSLFSDSPSESPEEVVRQLIDARLLTSYEIDNDDGATTRRVEIIHESLLANWPRLVRWQTQDADGAQLRDELRQAARTWDDHGRQADRLWTGAAYREFTVWKHRYPGRLTDIEEAFARAMTGHAKRRIRLRRAAVVSAFVGLLVVLAVVLVSHQQAIVEMRRAEAAKLVTLGRLELDINPTAGLAYGIKSLEIADSPEARRFVVEMLWRSPPALLLTLEAPGAIGDEYHQLDISPDDRWMATANHSGEVLLFRSDGRLETVLRHPTSAGRRQIGFGPESRILWTVFDQGFRRWAVPSGELIDTILMNGTTYMVTGDNYLRFEWTSADHKFARVRSWKIHTGEPRELGIWDNTGIEHGDVDPTGTWFAVPKGRHVYRRPVEALDGSKDSLLGALDEKVQRVDFSPSGKLLAVTGSSYTTSIWSLRKSPFLVKRTFEAAQPEPISLPKFDRNDSYFVWGSSTRKVTYLWDIEGPPDSEPLELRWPDADFYVDAAFSSHNHWLATVYHNRAAFWPIGGKWVRVLRGHTGALLGRLEFSNDGRWLATCGMDGVRLWPLAADGRRSRKIESCGETCWGLTAHPSRDELFVVGSPWGQLLTVPLDGSPTTQTFENVPGVVSSLAVDREGTTVAFATSWSKNPEDQLLRVLNLETGHLLVLPTKGGGPEDDPRNGGITKLRFAPDGTLFSSGYGGVRRWDLDTSTGSVVFPAGKASIDVSRDGRYLLAAGGDVDGYYAGETELRLFDLQNSSSRKITSHGTTPFAVAFDRSGQIIVTGDKEGVVRVGPVTGEDPHLLLGHTSRATGVAVSPDNRWVVSVAGSEVRLWPMPDISKPPLHTLPNDELLAKLKTLTNLRAVRDEESSTGWKIEVGPFPGWETVPTW